MNDAPLPRHTLRDALIDFYGDQHYRGNSPATLRFYRTNLERFQRDTGIAYLDEFQEAKIRAWLVAHDDNLGITGRFPSEYLYFRAFADYSWERGDVSKNAPSIIQRHGRYA